MRRVGEILMRQIWRKERLPSLSKCHHYQRVKKGRNFAELTLLSHTRSLTFGMKRRNRRRETTAVCGRGGRRLQDDVDAVRIRPYGRRRLRFLRSQSQQLLQRSSLLLHVPNRTNEFAASSSDVARANGPLCALRRSLTHSHALSSPCSRSSLSLSSPNPEPATSPLGVCEARLSAHPPRAN